jgi:hypothetical protein
LAWNADVPRPVTVPQRLTLQSMCQTTTPPERAREMEMARRKETLSPFLDEQ